MYPSLLKAIVNNIRCRIGSSIRNIGELLGISKSSIHRWLVCKEKAKNRSRNSSFVSYKEVVRKFMVDNPHTRLKDVQYHLEITYGRVVSISSICRYLRLLRISYKKIRVQSYSNMEKLKIQREEFSRYVKNIEKDRIISLDESYFYKRMYRNYGYSEVGKRCMVSKRIGMRKYSLILGISMKNVLAYEIVNGNVNSKVFYGFLKNKLLPICKDKIILMDNASFHKGKDIVRLIKDSGNRVMFVPPYSPECNPIEVVFHMMKSKLSRMVVVEFDDICKCLDGLGNFDKIYEHCFG